MKFCAIPVINIGIPASHENVSQTEYNKTKQEVVTQYHQAQEFKLNRR